MSEQTFNDGWNAALAGMWSPPLLATDKDRADYKSGWQQGTAELQLLVLAGNDKPRGRTPRDAA